MKARVEVIISSGGMMNVSISEVEKNQIRLYLLGQLNEADEERVELRLLSERAFSEEFDVVVDEIATNYVTGKFTGEEKTQVEQHFLRSPERQEKVRFICELLRQMDKQGEGPADVVPVNLADPNPASEPAPLMGKRATPWQRVGSFWIAQPAMFRSAILLATVLIVAGLTFWVISLNSKPIIASFELLLTNAERSVGTQALKVHLEPGTDELRIKLRLPTPAAQQYRASLRGERVSLRQLEIETQDAESLTVKVPADQITRGYYAIELTELNNGKETPLRGAYEFAIE